MEPARPLFIGRKPCLPSAPLLAGIVEAKTTLGALLNFPLSPDEHADGAPVRLFWDKGEQAARINSNRNYMITDERNWVSGLHGGGRNVFEGTMPRDAFGPREEQ